MISELASEVNIIFGNVYSGLYAYSNSKPSATVVTGDFYRLEPLVIFNASPDVPKGKLAPSVPS